MYSQTIDQTQCLCYSQDKLLEKQKTKKFIKKLLQRNHLAKRFQKYLNNSATVKHTIPTFFDGKVGDATYQFFEESSQFSLYEQRTF